MGNASDTACTDLSIHCLANGTSNSLWFDIIDRKWRCVEPSACCPFEYSQNVITCDEDSECVIDCAEESCHWSIINATHANSLMLRCGKDDECKLSKVHCPNDGSCNVECSGKQSCKFMELKGERLSSLSIGCESRSSCQLMSVNASVEGGNVEILCRSEWACANSKFLINASEGVDVGSEEGKLLKIECQGRYSCEGVEVSCPYRNEHSCLLRCGDDDSSCGGVHVFGVKGYEF